MLRPFRLLLDPAADAAGGAAGTSATTPPPVPPAAEPPKAPDPNKALLEELAAASARLRDFEAKEREREEAARKAAEDKAREKGDFDKILKERDERLQAEKQRAETVEQRTRTYARDSALAIELAKHNLVEDGAAQLQELWAKDFEAVPDGDGYNVRSKDRRTIAEVVAERLAQRRFEHFVKSKVTAGGGPANNSATPTVIPPTGQPPATYEEFVKQQMAAQPKGTFRAPVASGLPVPRYGQPV